MMQTKLSPNDFLSSLETIGLTHEEIHFLSSQKGFQQRQGGKIDVEIFLSILLSESVTGSPSYNDLASQMEVHYGIWVSKQAIAKKVNESCVDLLKAVLARVMSAQVPSSMDQVQRLCGQYKRVLIQDSTVIRLPARLFEKYSGVSNAHTTTCNARIQVVYDLIAGEFLYFSIDPYSKNDLEAAPELELQEGDLVLRDRGYLLYDEIQRHLDEGADCIYRHKMQNTYLDPKTGNPIDLLDQLERDGCIDMEVLLNNPSRTPVRLVAVPVPEDTANQRRMKLKKETRGKNPSKALLFLMSWTIFITTIPRLKASFQMLLKMYRLRWRIESIFKTWKSNMSFARTHNVSSCQLQMLVIARLITIVIINRFIYIPATERIRKCYQQELSLMKITKYLVRHLDRLIEIMRVLLYTPGRHRILDALAKYCSYDKRKRHHFPEMMDAIFEDSPLG